MARKSKDIDNRPAKGVSRRSILKGAGAAAGAAVGSHLVSAPMLWAQEIKDITLTHVGVSYSVIQAIGDQAAKDLGFKVVMQNLDTSAAITRFITQPKSVDIPDLEGWQAKVAVARGLLQGIEVKKVKEFDNMLPIFTKGEYEGKKVSRQGISPYEAMYVETKDASKIVEGVHDYMTMLPQVITATPWAIAPTWSIIRSPNGRICSIRSSKARPPSSMCRISASWMRPWLANRAATSSTRIRAT